MTLKSMMKAELCSDCDGEGNLPGGGICQECCPHDEYDHGICLDCEKDCTDDLVGAAESAFEGER